MSTASGPPSEPYHNYLHRKLLWDNLVEALTTHAHGRLLDVGCGTKPYAALTRGLTTEYVGLDVEDRGGADIIGSALEMPVQSGSFDTVLMTQVLEHVPEPQRVLSEACRVLGPGGVLILTAPFIWAIHEEPNDYFRYSEYGLRYLAEHAGLEVVSISPMGGFWATYAVRLSYLIHESAGRRLIGRIVPGICRLVQRVGSTWDSRWYRPKETQNYIMVARRPESVAACEV